MPLDLDLDLARAGALETADAVRRGAVSALEACEAAIARIEDLDGPINAVVVRDFDRARTAAKAVDASRTPDDPRPLLGVAMTVKESNDIEGLPTTWGFEPFKDRPAGADAVAVSRLKAAGAVILGKTNVSVALADWQSVNPVYGQTVNPHDHSRSSGGSSGGAAAALAAGMVPLELGSDIGGSIRIPAHFCGVFGHKPTYGLIPTDGHAPPGTDGVAPPLAVVGPLARRAEDLAAALDVMAGPVLPTPYRTALDRPEAPALLGLRVFVVAEHPSAGVDASVAGAISNLADNLAKAGATVLPRIDSLPDLAAAHRSYVKMLNTVIQRGQPTAEPIDAHAWMDLQDEQMHLTRAWRAVFETVDVVLAAPFGTPAFPFQTAPDWRDRFLEINGDRTAYGAQLAWAGLATFPGLPSTVAPIAKTEGGLPVGVQILAAPHQDYASIAFAGLLEKAGLTL